MKVLTFASCMEHLACGHEVFSEHAKLLRQPELILRMDYKSGKPVSFFETVVSLRPEPLKKRCGLHALALVDFLQ
jgi:hypothetical protein